MSRCFFEKELCKSHRFSRVVKLNHVISFLMLEDRFHLLNVLYSCFLAVPEASLTFIANRQATSDHSLSLSLRIQIVHMDIHLSFLISSLGPARKRGTQYRFPSAVSLPLSVQKYVSIGAILVRGVRPHELSGLPNTRNRRERIYCQCHGQSISYSRHFSSPVDLHPSPFFRKHFLLEKGLRILWRDCQLQKNLTKKVLHEEF